MWVRALNDLADLLKMSLIRTLIDFLYISLSRFVYLSQSSSLLSLTLLLKWREERILAWSFHGNMAW